MELRLLLDGGVPSGAPPGKIESSPGDDQFNIELTEQAQKLAIVEEMGCEPNVPPTNLDPESEKTETVVSEAAAAQSPMSIMLGQMILGRPEPSPIQNFVPNKQIAAARIDGELTVSVSTPHGLRDPKLEMPVTVLPSPEMVEKFEGWAKEFANRQAVVPENPAVDLITGETHEQKFDPEHLAALNVVFMSKRQVAGEQPAVVNPQILAGVETEAATHAVVEAPSVPSTPIQPQKHVMFEQTAQTASVQPNTLNTKVGEPVLVEHAEPTTEGTGVNSTTGSAVMAVSEKAAGSGMAGTDSQSSESFKEELTEKETQLEPNGVARQETGVTQGDKAVVDSVREPAQRGTMSIEDRQRNIDTISRKIEALAVNSVRNEIRVEMHPPEMGSVSINVKQAIDSLSVTLTASNDQVQEALHESRNDLAASLQVKAKQEVNIEIKAGQSQSLPQEQANANHQRNPQREQSEPRQ
ncbi:MAG TPA: flagellar hook-length control protein FliK, partial [Fimbriimonas sp.]|nr:flagellar hook-length control protein FliK [Fimbriimonas sp.]